MNFKRGSRVRAASPDSGIKAAYEAHLQKNEDESRDVITDLGRLITGVSIIEASVADYPIGGVGHSRLQCKPVRIARFTDGFILAGLDTRDAQPKTHRIRVQEPEADNTKIQYALTSCDSFGGQEKLVHINGFDDELNAGHEYEEFSKSELAMAGLRTLRDFAIEQQAIGWPHTYSLSMLPHTLPTYAQVS